MTICFSSRRVGSGERGGEGGSARLHLGRIFLLRDPTLTRFYQPRRSSTDAFRGRSFLRSTIPTSCSASFSFDRTDRGNGGVVRIRNGETILMDNLLVNEVKICSCFVYSSKGIIEWDDVHVKPNGKLKYSRSECNYNFSTI